MIRLLSFRSIRTSHHRHVRQSVLIAALTSSPNTHKMVTRCFSHNLAPTSTPTKSQTQPQELSKELWTLPNIITISRMCASPLLVYAIANDMKTLALAGCAAGAATDWLDGYIAKNYNQMSIHLHASSSDQTIPDLISSDLIWSDVGGVQSVWGGILDPLADKIFIGCLASGLAIQDLVPMPLLTVILGRDVFLVSCVLVFRAIQRPQGAAFFDSNTATFEIVPTMLSKVNTTLQFTLLGCTLSHFAFAMPLSVDTLAPLWYVTGATTVLSGLQYVGGAGIKRIGGSAGVAHSRKKFTWK